MVIKFLHIILLASVKYFFTLPYAMIIGLEYKQALIAVLIGGVGGFLFFFYLSKPIIRGLDFLWPHICRLAPPAYKFRYKALCERRLSDKSKKIFNRQSRIIAKIRSTYGLWGIIFATPFLLTIPVGAFLASKYYSGHKHIVLYMIVSIIGWAGVISGVVHLFPNVFF